jgi:hypothetical protein
LPTLARRAAPRGSIRFPLICGNHKACWRLRLSSAAQSGCPRSIRLLEARMWRQAGSTRPCGV